MYILLSFLVLNALSLAAVNTLSTACDKAYTDLSAPKTVEEVALTSSRNRDEFLKSFDLTPSEQLEFASDRYGGKMGEILYKKLIKLNPIYAPLIKDPGLILRYPEFEIFVHSHPEFSALDAAGIRQRFSEALGTVKAYRALALTEKEHQIILKDGMHSGLVRSASSEGLAEEKRRYRYAFRRDLNELISARISQNTGESDPLLSITNIPEIGTSIAKLHTNDGKHIYLFELNLPTIDVISSDYDLVGLMPGISKAMGGGDVESFVFYSISPAEIKSSQVVKP